MAEGMSTGHRPGEPHAPILDLNEKGRARNGEPQSLARRLFVQLLVFDGCTRHPPARRPARAAAASRECSTRT